MVSPTARGKVVSKLGKHVIKSPERVLHGDEEYGKHKVLGLKQQLEKFIYEEKEKTMMNKSDIPDPAQLDQHLEDIKELPQETSQLLEDTQDDPRYQYR